MSKRNPNWPHTVLKKKQNSKASSASGEKKIPRAAHNNKTSPVLSEIEALPIFCAELLPMHST